MIVAYFWRIKARAIPFALAAMAFDRFILRSSPNVGFFKSLGTGKGETFTPRDANPLRWGLIADVGDVDVFDNSFVIRQWRKNSVHEFRAIIEPISAHGKWAGQEPFTPTVKDWGGQVIAVTRARVRWSQSLRFWRAVPPVTASLTSAPGLIAAIGIGEAPIGLQGTFSIWESPAALRDFAYRSDAHNEVIAATAKFKWYSEELFSRFAVQEIRGSFNN